MGTAPGAQQNGMQGWDSSTADFAAQRMPIPHEVLADLADGTGDSPALTRYGRQLRAQLAQEPGFVILTGLERLPEDSWRAGYRALSLAVGECYPQDQHQTEIREVRDRGTRIGEGGTARYSDSRHGGSLHTDGAQAPIPLPDWFSLLCVRPAAQGGSLQLVSGPRIYDLLKRDRPELLKQLEAEFQFDRRIDPASGEGATTAKPVFFHDGGRVGVTYLREYIERGHERPGVAPLTDLQLAALDALDAHLYDPDLCVEGRLEAGEIIVIDNLRTLHGRTEFVDEPGRERLLLRMWLRRGSGRAGADEAGDHLRTRTPHGQLRS